MHGKISLRYWSRHKLRLTFLCLTIFLGAAALVFCGLLNRSVKMEQLEQLWQSQGEYDFIVHCMTEETVKEITGLEEVEAFGITYNLGDVQMGNGTAVPSAAYADLQSEQMFHLFPLRGNYPRAANEIAVDLSYAKACGIAPYPGQTVAVTRDGETKEYLISGIVEIQAQEEVIGGYYRYPPHESIGEFVPPLVYFYPGEAEPVSVTMYGQAHEAKKGRSFGSKLEEICSRHEEDAEEALKRVDDTWGRGNAYHCVLGIDAGMMTYDLDSVEAAIEGGDLYGDVNSRVLIPALSVLIGIVTSLTVYHVLKSALEDRMPHIGIMCSLGMSRRKCLLMLLRELGVIGAAGVAVGLLLATLLYRAAFPLLRDLGIGSSQNALQADPLIRQATYDPWIRAVVILAVSMAAACVVCMWSLLRMSLIEMLNGSRERRRRRKDRKLRYQRSTEGLLFDKINFLNAAAFLLVCIGMSASFFGILYYKEYGRRTAAIEFTNTIQTNGLNDYSYKAFRKNVDMARGLLENRHSWGISEESLREFLETEGIERFDACIVNRSGRLMKKEEWADLPEALKRNEIAPVTWDDNASEYQKASWEADQKLFPAYGYALDETAYMTPFVGMREENFAALSEYLTEGELDIGQVRAGRQVVLGMDEETAEKLKGQISVGDTITLSDILCNQGAEETDFGREYGEGELVYRKDFDDLLPVIAYCYGKRVDMETEVGAIAVMKEDAFSDFYFQKGYVNVFILPETYAAWGLPDRNYTQAAVKISEEADWYEIEKKWYAMVASSQGMSSYDGNELIAKEKAANNHMIFLFYQMLGLLIVFVLFGLVMSLYGHIRKLAPRIAVMRALGLSRRRLMGMILLQNVLAPLLGVFVSFLPVCWFQAMVNSTRNALLSSHSVGGGIGLSSSEPILNSLWFEVITYDLFSEDYLRYILLIFLAFLALTLIATVPQIYFSRKNDIVSEISGEKF